MQVEEQKEHRWLQRLVGEWTSEMEAVMEPGGAPMTETGAESTRSIGGVWVVSEGRGTMPDGRPSTTLMTLGYDPARQRFVGTFVGSMMTNLWVYEGELDAAADVLTLHTEGPSFADQGKTAAYRDAIELRGDDHRVLTSSYRGDDGEWHQFMTAHYRRRT
jgi:hypothetical protein